MAVYQSAEGPFSTTVLDIMQADGCFLSAPCGGRGTCGKCAVRFLHDAPPPSEHDRARFTREELAEGWRLACRERPVRPFAVEYGRAEEAMAVETGLHTVRNVSGSGPAEICAAVDLGTTTIAAALVDARTGGVIDMRTGVNHQRAFGADVISRIRACVEGKGGLLRKTVQSDIDALIRSLGADPPSVPIFISGNTTMQHLLQGLDCRGLGVAPFTPVDISLHTEANITYLPGVCTYVGADIVCGICSCGMDQSDELNILIDLGTNGEMAIGNRERLLAASTAAGPAFEGGNISCGTAGIPGAIYSVKIAGIRPEISTIGGREPVGICGTGVLETVYELLANGFMDETGRLDPDFEGRYVLHGDIAFTQKDIREVQMAKAAICAGLETLIDAYGVSQDEISHVYLAGGFGQKIDCAKAVGIGLLPEKLLERIVPVGNSSLAGAVEAAVHPQFRERLAQTASRASEVSLSGSVVFADRYIDAMFLPGR